MGKMENAGGWYEHGKVFEEQNDLYRAESDYRKALSLDPTHLGAMYRLAIILYHSGNYSDSIELLKKSIELHPEIALLHNTLGLAYKRAGSYKKAIMSLANAISRAPNMAEAYNNMGLVFEKERKHEEALKCYRQATEVNGKYAVAYYNSGMLLFSLGIVDEAITAFKKAILSKKNFSEAFNNLGIAFQYQGKHKRAFNCFQVAVRSDTNNFSASYNLAILFQHRHQFKEAKACIEKTLTLNPNDSKIFIPYYQLLRDVCDWQQAAVIGKQIEGLTKKSLQAGTRPDEMPFLNLIRSQDKSENLEIAESWSRELLKEIDGQQNLTVQRNKFSDKITIGYLSDGFRNHPNTHLIADIFKYHNPKKFNVYCYSYGENDNNPYRKRIEKGCDHFIDLENENDFSIASRINHDRCDILVDLKGYIFGSRLKICAYRPAPIQVRYLGMPGTTGSPFFDYLITDRIVTPENFTPFYSEKFAYLPNCYQVNSIPHAKIITPLSRNDAGLPEHGFVYCSFCSAFKIDAETFGIWMTILQRTPGSYLWLLKDTEEFVANLKAAATSRGIDSRRIIFADRCDREKHLARLGCADLALDTKSVNGALTTSDALWAGVPVVSLKGKTFISRMSASILQAVGLEEMVCADLKEYENIAIYYATHSNHLGAIKDRFDHEALLGTLYDTKSFVKSLEGLYTNMWDTHVAGNPPSVIYAG